MSLKQRAEINVVAERDITMCIGSQSCNRSRHAYAWSMLVEDNVLDLITLYRMGI
jgi:hypothetical protein